MGKLIKNLYNIKCMGIRDRGGSLSRVDKRHAREFMSGKLSEIDSLGTFKQTDEYRRAFQKEASESGYVPFEAAMKLIRDHEGEFDPTNPDKPFANELRIAIAEELGLEGDDMDRIQFHTAVGTPLDHFHGIDAWVEFVPGRGGARTVTLDYTDDPGKIEHKADIIVHDVSDPSKDEDAFMKKVYDDYAPMIAKKLETAVGAFRRRQERAGQMQNAAK
jgi:hypothetical protein